MEAAEPIAAPGTARWRERARDPVLTALALLLAVVSFVTSPLLISGVIAAYALNLSLWVLIIAAICVLVRPGVAAAVVILGVAFAGVDIQRVFGTPDTRLTYASIAFACVFLLVLITAVGGAVFAPGRVTYHRILGAIVLYMAIAYLFTGAYHLITILAPGAFTGVDAPPNSLALISQLTYFSYTTLTSTGYGDIAPLHPVARSLANLESMIGQLYPATLLARMVTLYDSPGRR
jgi:hypothetical protein